MGFEVQNLGIKALGLWIFWGLAFAFRGLWFRDLKSSVACLYVIEALRMMWRVQGQGFKMRFSMPVETFWALGLPRV